MIRGTAGNHSWAEGLPVSLAVNFGKINGPQWKLVHAEDVDGALLLTFCMSMFGQEQPFISVAAAACKQWDPFSRVSHIHYIMSNVAWQRWYHWWQAKPLIGLALNGEGMHLKEVSSHFYSHTTCKFSFNPTGAIPYGTWQIWNTQVMTDG